MKGIFDAKTESLYKDEKFILNCHVCGKTYSPLEVFIIPTDIKKYYLGTYCRLCHIVPLKDYDLCDCITKQFRKVVLDGIEYNYVDTFHYDSKDNMQRRIATQDELKGNTNG